MSMNDGHRRSTLEAVRALGPRIRERAGEIEHARDVPSDIVEELRNAGVFSRYVPRSHGGQELWPAEAIETVEELARADGSVGWIALVGSEGPIFYSYLPAETYDKIYADGPDVIHAGSIMAGKGRVTRVSQGYQFSGRWSFASGCTHTDNMCVLGFLQPVVEGERPRQVFGIVKPSQVEIIDTWHVGALRGTASRDILAEGLFVPDEWTGSFDDPPTVRHPLDGHSFLARFGIEHAALATGIAQGALDDIVAIAAHKKPLGGMMPRLGGDPVFQHTVGELATDLDMARALLYDVARSDQASAVAGPPGDSAAARRKARLARVAAVAVSVVDGCYAAAGTTALFDENPLGRRLRDAHGAAQHFLLSARTSFLPAGAAVLGDAG
jgi:indole-3-acetate monooxygenase